MCNAQIKPTCKSFRPITQNQSSGTPGKTFFGIHSVNAALVKGRWIFIDRRAELGYFSPAAKEV
jgi:hypothetical protein